MREAAHRFKRFTLKSSHRRAAAVVCLAALAWTCASAPTLPPGFEPPSSIEVHGAFQHASGLEFPEEFRGFKRKSIVQFHQGLDNFMISYVLDANPTTLVSAYVYPAEAESLDDHFRAVIAEVTALHRATPFRNATMSVTKDGQQLAGRVASFEFKVRMESGAKRLVCSHAYLFSRGVWFIKYRVTNEAAHDDDLQARVRELIASLSFPPSPQAH